MNVLESVLGVFESVSEWMVTAFQNVTPMFYVAETGLTFLGVLAVAGLAVGLCLLIIAVVTKFLRFGG